MNQLLDIANLTDATFLLYAMGNYENPNMLSPKDFFDDLKRIKYLRKLFNKYVETEEIREKLAVNHTVILTNAFGVLAGTRMLFFKVPVDQYPLLKTILVYRSIMPDVIYAIRGENIVSSDIPLDARLTDKLRKL